MVSVPASAAPPKAFRSALDNTPYPNGCDTQHATMEEY